MKVIIRTEWPGAVKDCLASMELGSYVSAIDGSIVTLNFFDDYVYRDVTAWLGSAMACGLILRGEIER